MPHLSKNKTKIKTQSSADKITPSFSLAHQRKNKQVNKNSAEISSYKKLIQTTGPTLGEATLETKRKKEFNLETWEKETSNTVN